MSAMLGGAPITTSPASSNRAHGAADLVTAIGNKAFWGQGLASGAITLGSRVAFEVYRLRKLHVAILASKTGSIKAYTRGCR